MGAVNLSCSSNTVFFSLCCSVYFIRVSIFFTYTFLSWDGFYSSSVTEAGKKY